ncbi:hypothetical protein [Streptomyces celluloflavus]|uniref:hypothetical protein n=1 Tax=Streptomyces celluloflavus TaxID=58344 RepID=UPI0036CD58C2
MVKTVVGSRIQNILNPASGIIDRNQGGGMWSGGHNGYLEQTGRMIAEELQRSRSRQRAKAAKYSKELVEQSRKIAHETEAVELERLAVLGQIPQAEYKARMAALEEEADEDAPNARSQRGGHRHGCPCEGGDESNPMSPWSRWPAD